MSVRSLTAEDWENADKWRQKCSEISTSTEPMDLERAKENISKLYEKMGWQVETWMTFQSPAEAKEYILEHHGAEYLNTNFYGNQEMYWIAFLLFGREDMDIDYGDEKNLLLDIWYAIAQSCGWWFVIDQKTCYIVDRPAEVHLDDQQRLHSETDYAMKWRDGWGVCVYNGLFIPEEYEQYIMDSSKLTIEIIDQAQQDNADIARVLIELMGQSEYLHKMDMEVVAMDYIKVTNEEDSPSMPRMLMRSKKDNSQYLVGTDGSTNRVYYMEVDPDVTDCVAAHNSIAPVDESNILASS